MPRSMKKLLSVPLVAGLLALAISATAVASQPRVPVGNVARLTPGAKVMGAVSPGRRLRVTIGLQSRDPLGLARLATAVSTPGNPQYGRFLSVRGFAARFGAPTASIARVRRALRGEGLSVVRVYANHLSIVASGPARTIERAFATRLSNVRLANGRRTLVNTNVPTVPANLGPDVQAILGLDGLAVPQPLNLQHESAAKAAARVHVRPLRARGHARAHAVGTGPQPCAAATAVTVPSSSNGNSFGYTAPLMSSAYGLQPLYASGDYGQGQTIVLYEAESLDPNDIAAFQACYGTSAPVTIRNVDTPDPVDYGADGDAEAALDVDQIIGMAPQASIIVYQASQNDLNGNSELLSAIASQDAGKTVSISYGLCESLVGKTSATYEAKLFQEMAVQGQSVYASSADSGSETCSNSANGGAGSAGNQLSVSDPASQPTVTGVGGTSLYSGSAAAPTAWTGANALTEGIWNSGSYTDTNGDTVSAATGGGVSSLWAMPSFQSTAAAGLGVVNGYSGTGGCGASTCREVPDVSADGDPQTGAVVYANSTANGGGGASAWQLAGGTSAAAPLWAAFTALTNVQPTCRGLSVGDLNPSLYALAGSNYGAYFRDVNAPSAFTGLANNDSTGTNGGLYPVTAGYDLTTGLGSPLVNALAPALCALRAPVYSVAVQNPGTVRVTPRTKAKIAIKATDSGGAALVYTASGLPAGMKINASTGVISGRPTKRGRYKVTVAAEDFATNSGGAQFTLLVAQPSAKISRVSLSGVTKRHARLRFTATRPQGRKLRSVTVRFKRRSGLSFGRLRGRVFVYTATGKHHRRVAFRVKLRHGAVTIRFRHAEKKVRVTLGVGSIRVSRTLARRASRRGATLHLPLRVTDSKRHTTRTTAKVRVKASHHRRRHHKKHGHKKRHHH